MHMGVGDCDCDRRDEEKRRCVWSIDEGDGESVGDERCVVWACAWSVMEGEGEGEKARSAKRS